MSLYERFTTAGKLSKPKPKRVSDLDRVLPATVNWMRGLALIVGEKNINSEFSKSFYSRVGKRTSINELEVNSIFEQLIFAIHHCSALHALCQVPCKTDIARVGIVAWYYGIYTAASAMVAAQDGSFQDDHNSTAIAWDSQIAKNNLIAHPFDLHITTLVKKDANEELKSLLITDKFTLSEQLPKSAAEAYGACHAYLSGSVIWRRNEIKDKIKLSKEFKALNVSNFRTKGARELRDKRLNNKTFGFLHEAIRYRGNANYRSALFLGVGTNTETTLNHYIDDLAIVLDAFVCQAGIFCSRRLGKEIWEEFLTDLETERAFSLAPSSIWGNA